VIKFKLPGDVRAHGKWWDGKRETVADLMIDTVNS
jgi:hypothetical protein